MGILAILIQLLTKSMAISAFGSASHWGAYQAKEPKNIFEK